MRKKKTPLAIIAVIALLLAAYAFSVRFQRNARYAKVFHQFGKDCQQRQCPLRQKVALAEKAVYHDPEFSEGYSVLGELHMEKGEVPLALEFHQKALGLDLKNERSLLALGIHYFNENDLVRSLRYLNYFDSFYNRNYALKYYLGRIYERLNNSQRALDYYKDALRRDTTKDLRVLARIGSLEARSGRVKEAFEYAREIRSEGDEQLAKALEVYVQGIANAKFRTY